MSGTEIIAVLVMFCLAVWLIGARFTITNLVRISGATLMIFGGDSIAFRGLNNQNEYSLTWTVLGILIFLFGICIVAASLFASETFTKKDAAEEKSSESTKPP